MYFGMTTQPFLEIVVPTFNRSHILASTLKELASAASGHKGTIALRVIDNCSTDSTPSVVKPYVENDLLVYERNELNIGLIRNIARSIYTSRAKWVWVFGDDDHILLHSLPYLVGALVELPADTVFARALCAKVTSNGCLAFIEKGCSDLDSLIYQYTPGVNIARHGSIHSLAFISQLIVNPAHWNQNLHDKIYKATDLYTFVLVLLNESITKKTCDLNIHVVAATDRGDRSYYTPNMCVARLTEYTSYERLVHATLGRKRARKVLLRGRKRLLSLRVASCFKLIKNKHTYQVANKDPISYMLSYDSPYIRDVIVIRSIALLSKLPGASKAIELVYDFLSSRT